MLLWYEILTICVKQKLHKKREREFNQSQNYLLRKIKLKKEKELDSDIFSNDIYSFLVANLAHISGEREYYNRWKAAEVNQRTLARWIDTVVQEKWDYETAARAHNIAIEGYDIQVKTLESDDSEQDSRREIPLPSELTPNSSQSRYYVLKNKAPEDFAPARHAFDVSLILGWVLSQHRTIPFQLKWVDISYLMENLVAMDESLRFLLPKSQPSLFD